MILCNTQKTKISLDSSFLLILRKHFMLYHVHLYKNHSNSSISVHQYKNGSDFSIQTAHLLITNVDICKKFLLCIEDAVRDRDPLSPYLFLICAEILAILIRRNSDIKGIYLVDKEKKITMLADDTSMLVDGSE